jgi:hypothetical protein
MSKYYKNYNPVKWDITLEYITKKSRHRQLNEFNRIPITENELISIQDIRSKTLQRLAFILLCLAKYYNLSNPQNNDWVNTELKEMFSLAHLQKTRQEQALLLSDLKNLGYLTFSKRVDNNNVNVQYIDNESDVIFYVDDFRELGYQYLNYLNPEDFSKCKECDRLIRKSGKRLYCKEHQGYVSIENKIIKCDDCGEEFVVDAKANNISRCKNCAKDAWREYNKNKQREYYNLRNSV